MDRYEGGSGRAVVEAGTHVLSSDGREIGRVKEIEGAYFKVAAPFHRDYWLAGEHVRARVEKGVVLDIEKSVVGEYKLKEPGLPPEEDPFRDVSLGPAITEQELLEQRARMERELAEQSKDLPDSGPTPTEQRPRRSVETIPADHASFRETRGEQVPYAPALSEEPPPEDDLTRDALDRDMGIADYREDARMEIEEAEQPTMTFEMPGGQPSDGESAATRVPDNPLAHGPS